MNTLGKPSYAQVVTHNAHKMCTASSFKDKQIFGNDVQFKYRVQVPGGSKLLHGTPSNTSQATKADHNKINGIPKVVPLCNNSVTKR